jgi:hypothetical protein
MLNPISCIASIACCAPVHIAAEILHQAPVRLLLFSTERTGGRVFSPHGGLRLGYFCAPALSVPAILARLAARSAVIEPFWRHLYLSKKVQT